jgi:hypothetical protein
VLLEPKRSTGAARGTLAYLKPDTRLGFLPMIPDTLTSGLEFGLDPYTEVKTVWVDLS